MCLPQLQRQEALKPATLTMSSRSWIVLLTVFLGSVMFGAGYVFAREIHALKAGDDSGPGSGVRASGWPRDGRRQLTDRPPHWWSIQGGSRGNCALLEDN